MKNLDYNQIKIFINLEITGKRKIIYIYIYINIYFQSFFFFLFYNLVKPLDTATTSKPNFYYIVYNMRTI